MKKKCQVVMFATEKNNYIGNIIQRPSDKRLAIINVLTTEDKQEYINQHLYITSSDKIKEGDWYYDSGDVNFICKGFKHTTNNYNRLKIIATTDPELHTSDVSKIGFSFIDDYITEYNKGNVIKEVNVDYEELYLYPDGNLSKVSRLAPNAIPINKPKLRLNNTIIINRLQEVFTKEDMMKALKFNPYECENGNILGKKSDSELEIWFEQNY